MRDFSSKFAPLQPSSLQYTSGPTSPASPKSPFGLRPRPLATRSINSIPSPTTVSEQHLWADCWKPVDPSRWTWRCHLCHTQYPLGATRRCLIDGHYLCTGEVKASKRTGKFKRRNACSSDFDYKGWHLYSMRRETLNRKNKVEAKGCSNNCFHPSECRWHPEQHTNRINDNAFEGEVTLSYNFDGSTSVKFGPEGPTQALDDKVREYLATRHSRSVSESTEPPQKVLRHPNPLASTPPAPAIAGENDSGKSIAVAELMSPAVEGKEWYSVRPSTAAAPRNERSSSKTICKSIAERTARRKARKQAKIITPLSPIIEEIMSPREPASSNEKVSRPALNFSNHLGGFLDSKGYGPKSLFDSDSPRQDVFENIETKSYTGLSGPFLSLNADFEISRPALEFTRYFERFLESQQHSNYDSSIAPKPLFSEESDKMDLDDPNASIDSKAEPDLRTADATADADVDMLSDLSNSFEKASVAPGNAGFNFEFGDEASPLSPRRNAWDWSTGGIGMALSSPLGLTEDSTWGDRMQVDYGVW